VADLALDHLDVQELEELAGLDGVHAGVVE
jgi:hypothetical protein